MSAGRLARVLDRAMAERTAYAQGVAAFKVRGCEECEGYPGQNACDCFTPASDEGIEAVHTSDGEEG